MLIARDFGYAIRRLLRSPSLFLVSVLSLGVCIVGVASVWTFSWTTIFAPLPYDPEGELVFVGTIEEGRGTPGRGPTAVPDFLDIREGTSLMDVAAYRPVEVNLSGDVPEHVVGSRISANFLSVLLILPNLGRDLARADETPGGEEIALLSHELWQRRFGGTPDVLGSSIRIDGVATTVIGVLPEGFQFGFGPPAQVWLPMRMTGTEPRDARTVSLVGRVEGGQRSAAALELFALGDRLREANASSAQRSFSIAGVRETWYGGATYRRGAIAMVTATLGVLLIACINLAGLLLARGFTRAGEARVRRALGASRARLFQQFLVEVAVLAAASGGIALGLFPAAVSGLTRLAPEGFPGAADVGMNLTAFMTTLGIVALAGGAVGMVPAAGVLRKGMPGPGQAGRLVSAGRRFRNGLVSAQIAVAFVLLVSTALAARSMTEYRTTDTGFAVDRVGTFKLRLPETSYPDESSLRAAAQELEDALRRAPGIESVGLGLGLPAEFWNTLSYSTVAPGVARRSVRSRQLTPGYREALEIALIEGRGLASTDDESSPDVALVNRSFASLSWPDSSPLGRLLYAEGRSIEVVGIVEDVRERGPSFPAMPWVYLPMNQWPVRNLSIVFRQRGGESVPLDALREAVSSADPDLAVYRMASLRTVVDESSNGLFVMGSLLAVLAILALSLAVVGVYSAMRYAVTVRVPELGIRSALGAGTATIRGMVWREATMLVLVGIGIGALLSWAAGRGLSAVLLGVESPEPWTLGALGALMWVVTLAAAWPAVRQAGSVDPLAALRVKPSAG